MSESPENIFDVHLLAKELRPFRLHHFPELPSTNDYAIEARRKGELFAPAIILADSQTAGRGRGANRWHSSTGSLAITYVFPVEENLRAHQLPLVAGLAVRNAVAELTTNSEIKLKWPNDLIYFRRKIAGLLCERIAGADLVGIGLIVNNVSMPANLKRTATNLCTIAGRPLNLNTTVITLTHHLRHYLLARKSRSFAAFVDEYRQHDGLLGASIAVSLSSEPVEIKGTCDGIDTDGRLLVRTGNKVRKIITGGIRMVLPASQP